MYSGITKIYYRKTVGHTFTKPVQIERTTQFFPPIKFFFHRSSHFCRQAMRVYVVRKWPRRGRSRFVCWTMTRVSLWLLCNVHFVQSTQRTRPQSRPFVRGINNLMNLGVCASRKHPCVRVCGKNLNTISMCAVSPVVLTSNISSCKKKISFPLAVNNSIKVGPLVFLL